MLIDRIEHLAKLDDLYFFKSLDQITKIANEIKNIEGVDLTFQYVFCLIPIKFCEFTMKYVKGFLINYM